MKAPNTYYAAATVHVGPPGSNKHKTILMHRVVTGAAEGQVVDHKDHNGLNNQVANLGIVTRRKNQLNRRDLDRNNTSGVSGVTWHKNKNKWVAQMSINEKNHYIGIYEHLEDAAMAVIDYEPKPRQTV